jgi:hypothetical protein
MLIDNTRVPFTDIAKTNSAGTVLLGLKKWKMPE